MWTTVLLGLPVGLLFGYCLQRGGFCMNSALRQVAFERDTRLFKAYLLAVAIQALVLALLAAPLRIEPAVPPVFWAAALGGGFVFGFGMVLARGCASGNLYRVGEGLIGAYVVLLSFLLAILVTESGVLAPLRSALRAPVWNVPGTFDAWLGVPKLGLALALGAGVALWIWRGAPGEAPDGRWHWLQTGLAVGLVATVAWIASALTGRQFGLSTIQPVSGLGHWLTTADASGINWSAFVLLTIPLGAAWGGLQSGQFAWRLPYPTRILQQMGGGVLMGVGGSIAGGCNIGHGLSGMAVFSVTSLLVMIALALGCWAGVWLFFLRLKVAR